jgi:hypothetical protein
MHRFLLHNDSIRETTEACLLPGQVGFMNGWGVFSTLTSRGWRPVRVGTPLGSHGARRAADARAFS